MALYQVGFYYTANSAKSLYKLDYATQAAAQADADWLLANAFWFDIGGTVHTGVYAIIVEEEPVV